MTKGEQKKEFFGCEKSKEYTFFFFSFTDWGEGGGDHQLMVNMSQRSMECPRSIMSI